MRILLIAADGRLRGQIRAILERQGGHTVDVASTREEAMKLVVYADTVILDPDDLGPEMRDDLIREIKAIDSPLVMVLSKQDSWDARGPSFDAGADDYLCKPYQDTELLVRMMALARRI